MWQVDLKLRMSPSNLQNSSTQNCKIQKLKNSQQSTQFEKYFKMSPLTQFLGHLLITEDTFFKHMNILHHPSTLKNGWQDVQWATDASSSAYFLCIAQGRAAFQPAFKVFHMSGSEVKTLQIGRIWKGVKIENTWLDLTPVMFPLWGLSCRCQQGSARCTSTSANIAEIFSHCFLPLPLRILRSKKEIEWGSVLTILT